MSVYLNLQETIAQKSQNLVDKTLELVTIEKSVKNERIELQALKEKRKEMLEHLVYNHQVVFLTRLSACAKLKETNIHKRGLCVILESGVGELTVNTSLEYGWKVTTCGEFPEQVLDKVHTVLREFSIEFLEQEADVKSVSN